ncbi:MAG TPA: TolC family protein [Vicinamibacteria bacterium]|nr:TolC family protein [Vicinamibacteria bacterium]
MTVLALAVGVRASAETAAAAPEVLTLDEAVALALRQNRSLAGAAMSVDRAEQKIGVARARRLPSLDFQGLAGTTLAPIRVTFPAGSFGTFPATGPIPSQDSVIEAPRSLSGNVNVTVAQPLSQLHRIGLNTKLSELSRDLEQERLRESRTEIAAEVRRLYYSLLQSESMLRSKLEQVRVYRELDRLVGEQVRVEVALRSESLGVKARLASEEYGLTTLQGDISTAKEKMNLLLGRELDQDFSVAAVTDTRLEEVDLRAAMATALERRPDLAQARLAVEQADTDLRMKKAERIPDISLGVSVVSFINVDLVPRTIAQAGLQVKWEPFDWGRRGKERAEKTIQVEQAKLSAREARDRARLEVGERFRKLQEARLLVEAQQLSRDAADEKLRVSMSRNRYEANLVKDVLDAQASTSAAHSDYDRALLTFWTAKADFQKAIGQEQ